MTRFTIELPDELSEVAAARAAAAGHSSADDYLTSLVVDAMRGRDPGCPPGVVSADAPDELERLIAERWDDDEGSFEPDEAFYECLRDYARRVPERDGK